MRLLLALAAFAACDGGGHHAPTPKVPPAPVAAPAPVVPAAAATAATGIAVASPAPTAATGIAVSSLVFPIIPLESPRRRHANPYLDAALTTASHGGTNEPGQVVRGVLAVAADPSSVTARFVEACLLAQVDEHELARAVMVPVRDANGCASCGDALVELHNDVCGFDDETKKLATNAKPSPMRAAATAVLASLNSGNDAIDSYLDSGIITMTSHCSVCDEPIANDTKYNATTFKAFVRDADKRSGDAHIYSSPVFLFCDGRCCTGPTGYLNHSTSSVFEVCFRGGATAPKLASISALAG